MPSRHGDIASRNPWKDPLVVAFFVSAAIHLMAFGLVLLSPALSTVLGLSLAPRGQEDERLRIARIKALQEEQEPPLLFVNVDPAVATEEEPESAKFYSDKSSKAADAQSDRDLEMPQIDGEQTQVVKAEDTPRTEPRAEPLQPRLPPRPEPKPPEPRDLAEGDGEEQQKPGDLAMAKPSEPQEEAPTIGRDRPRTIVEARIRKGLAGEKMKLDGGTRRQQLAASFDVKGTPFGVYDAALVEAIDNRWHTLLDARDFARERAGKVVLEFRLNQDGRITNLEIVESTVGDPGILAYLCQRAVEDPSPYAPWSMDMRRAASRDYRHVRFTFYYN